MTRSIIIFSVFISGLFLLSSCNDDSIQHDEAMIENNEEGHTHQRSCGHDLYLQNLNNDPVLRSEHEDRVSKFEQYSATSIDDRALCNNPVKLPVAVHFRNISNPNKSCLATLVQNQINTLSKDFQGLNSDVSKWNNQAASQFPGVSLGQTCLDFVLATQNHPSGFGLSNGDLAITYNQFNGENDSRWSGYVNIIVKPNTGALGYSPLGSNGNGDALVIDASAFGVGSGCGSVSASSPFNLGRTLTHEVGHYLYLEHIWGDGGCNVDDGVSDTPKAGAANYGCPNLGKSSCSSKDLFMNYMDYVDDACMYMFSQGQSTRMQNWVSANMQNVISKGNTVLGNSGTTGGGNTGGGTTGGNNTCSNTSSITASNVTSSTARISWSSVNGAIRYNLKYRKLGTSSWINRYTTNTSRDLTSLSANTTYQYKVRTQCPSGWTSNTAIKTFKTTGNTGGGSGTSGTTTVKMNIKLDYYGSETSWELVKASGQSVSRGGPYQDGQAGAIKSKSWSLSNGCYTFYIDDSYGDGICCDYGNGYAKILKSNNQVVGQSNGNFGYYDYIDFCVNNGNVSFQGGNSDTKAVDLQIKDALMSSNR